MNAQQRLMNDFEAWNDRLHTVCGRFQTRLAPEHSMFIGEINHHEAGGFAFTEIRTNAGRIGCERTSSDHVDDSYCFLIVQESGCASLHHQNETVELRPGDMALMDPKFACEIIPHGLIRHTSFHLNRHELSRRISQRDIRFGKLQPNSMSSLLLRSLTHELSHVKTITATDDEGEALHEALLALLTPALNRAASTSSAAEAFTESRLHDSAVALIECSLDSPMLSPAWLAQQLGISVRHLYRAFEGGESICRHIMRARLERSAQALGQTNRSGESITHIAHRWGFTDSAHFSRSFKRHFGCSPREYRSDAKHNLFRLQAG